MNKQWAEEFLDIIQTESEFERLTAAFAAVAAESRREALEEAAVLAERRWAFYEYSKEIHNLAPAIRALKNE